MQVHETPLKGVLRIEPAVFSDARGFFLERYHSDRYRGFGIEQSFVQENFSRSIRGALRGLHFQKHAPQGKLVEVVRGRVLDVVVDVQPDSTTFAQWYSVELSDRNHYQLWIPPGFAHGFCVISEQADFLYKCTERYDPNDEGGIIWNDPQLDITWPFRTPLLSEKDAKLPCLEELSSSDLPILATTVAQ